MKSLLVIGGGLVGAASALRLQAAGVQVTLIDPGDKRRAASYGNAGHLGSEQVSPWSEWSNVWRAPASSFAVGGPLDFRWSDIGLWAPWSLRFLAASDPYRFARGTAALKSILADAVPAWHRIAELAGAPDIVVPHGHVTAWMSPEMAERGLALHARTDWGGCTYREMNAGELARYQSVMKQAPVAGVLFGGTGQVRDPQGARDAMMASFVARGGEVVADKVASLDANGRVHLVSGATREADAVLVAAGAWSGALMRQLGVAAPVIGERGYSVQTKDHDWPEDLPTTVFEGHFVVLSRFTSGLRATSVLEFGSPDAPGDPRKWALLEQRIANLGVRFPNPDRWVGARPTLPDYVPAIGRLERAPRIFYAFGHAHLGLTMAPITSEIVTALVTNHTPPIDLAPLRIERFR
jgi:glycine/D-amino acid oxidase-like deaminating enzyme